jgi:C1A family cysteine protease
MLGFRADLISDDSAGSNNAELEVEAESEQTYPAALDWRNNTGILAPIKNQGSCGGCYAFASMEATQALYHISKGAWKNGTVINLAEQQVIDCSSSSGNQGCNGGLMEYVFNYLKNTPVMFEADYVYTAVQGSCRYVASKGVLKVSSYKMITANNPTAHVAALQTGPTTIALAANSSVFQLYRSGIITSTSCGTVMDHAVTLVGYGTSSGQDYWIVKNSWGATWGEAGYVRIARSMTGTNSGICGLLQHTVQPLTI